MDDDAGALAGRLAERRVAAERRLVALTRDFDEIVESSALSPPDDEHDPDGTTIAFERAQITALRDEASDELVAFDRALEQVRKGTYGLCEVCGDRITAERLDALPTTQRCIRCAR